MTQDQLEELAKKVKEGTATKEELDAFMDGISGTLTDIMAEAE